jgi:hypothetical protein
MAHDFFLISFTQIYKYSMKGILASFPWLARFFIFTGMLLVGSVIASYASLTITDLIFPEVNLFELLQNVSSTESSDAFTYVQIQALKCFQFIGSLGQYVLIPMLFVYLCGESFFAATGMHKHVHLRIYLLVFLIFFSSVGFIGYINELNQMLTFPSSLSGLEHSLRQMENEAMMQTEAFLSTTSLMGLLLNILLVAVLAAVGEEIVFRGLLQNMLQKLTKNVHVAVWTAAAIFSFVHFQFFGFFPRLLLGAILGYLFAWSGSLWPSIAGHFINNFLGVMGYYFVNNGMFDEHVMEEASWQYALFSLPFLLLFLFLYNKATEHYRYGERLDDGVQH